MRDLQEQLRNHVDAASPPVDVYTLAQRLGEADGDRDVVGSGSEPPRRRDRKLRPAVAFASGVLVTAVAIGAVVFFSHMAGAPVVENPTVTVSTIPGQTTLPSTPTTPSTSATPTTAPEVTLPVLSPPLGEPPEAGPVAPGEPAWTFDDLSSNYLSLRDALGSVTSLTIGDAIPPLNGDNSVPFLDGSTGNLLLEGRSHLIVVWSLPAGLDDRSVDVVRYQLDLLEIYGGLYGGAFDTVSVLMDGSDIAAAKALVDRRGYTFDVALAEPGAWGITGTDVTPMWLLTDESGSLVSGFFAWGDHPVPPIGLLISDYYRNGLSVVPFARGSGLAGNCSPQLAVATDGSLWNASRCGVQVLDGLEWTTVLELEFATVGASESVDIETSRDGVWVGTEEGTQLFDGVTWVDMGLTGSFAVAPDGTAYSMRNGAVYRFDDGTWTQIAIVPAGLSEGAPDGGAMAVGPDGDLWVSTESALWRFDGSTWSELSGGTPQSGAPGHIPGQPSPWLAVGPDGSVWFNNGSSLGRYLDGEWSTFDTPSPEWVAFGPGGVVWVADNATGALAIDGDTVTRYGLDEGLPSDQLTHVVVTPDGAVWFSTMEDGVFRLEVEG